MKRAGRKGIWGLLVFFLCSGLAFAQSLNVGVNAPDSELKPEQEFPVDLYFRSDGRIYLGKYSVRIQYDRDVIEPVRVEIAQGNSAHPEFNNPSLEALSYQDYIQVSDGNDRTQGCIDFNGILYVARIWFKVKKNAPLGVTRKLHILEIPGVWDCEDVSLEKSLYPPPYLDDSFVLVAYQQISYNFDQYLDVTGDYTFTEDDVDFLWEILSKYKFNVEAEGLVKLGGIQLDQTGNSRVERYDHGYSDAVARPTRFIYSGNNGICESRAGGDDIQLIPEKQGEPDTVCIYPGPDNILDSAALGDDQIVGMIISSGANGICESKLGGDDLEVIPLDQGAPNQICISPGPDGYLNSSLGGDDKSWLENKDTGAILGRYSPKGSPYYLQRVYPPQEHFYMADKGTIPILVRIVDRNGDPKSGVAPFLRVESGEARFVIGDEYHTKMEGQPADQFLGLGKAPEGTVGGLLSVPLGDVSVIDVELQADESRGIRDPMKLSFIIETPSSARLPVDELKITPDHDNYQVGERIYLTINAFDKNSAPLPGYSSRIKVLSSRGIKSGGIDQFGGEYRQEVFFDDFEDGDISDWTISGKIDIDTKTPGWFGNYHIFATDSRLWSGYMENLIPVREFTNLELSYQWKYEAKSSYDSYMEIQYYNNNAKQWITIKRIYGQELLGLTQTTYLWDRVDLSGVKIAGEEMAFRFYFHMQPYDTFYLDNIIISSDNFR